MRVLTIFCCRKERRRPLLAVLSLLSLISGPVYAQDAGQAEPSIYEIEGVEVDVTAANAAAARDKAIADGQRAALGQLLDRMGATGTMDPVGMSDTQIANLVQSFEIASERSSAVRYIATLNVRFKPTAVRGQLDKTGAAYTEARSRPALILPVMPVDGRDILWDDRTPWRTAWENAAGNSGIVPLAVPAGDLGDIAALSASDAKTGTNSEGFAKLASAYGAGHVVVAALTPNTGNQIDPTQAVVVSLQRFTTDGSAAGSDSVDIPARPQRTMEQLATEGVKLAREHINRGWEQESKMAAVANTMPLMRLPATVPIVGPQDWAGIRQLLSQVPLVKRAQVLGMTRSSIAVELQFHGDIDQLRAALAQGSLTLDISPDGSYWRLHR